MSKDSCGPKQFPSWIRKRLSCYFEKECMEHDKGYGKGGSEIERFTCDWEFWLSMKMESFRHKGMGRLLRLLVALTFFKCVRVAGSLSFKYSQSDQ